MYQNIPIYSSTELLNLILPLLLHYLTMSWTIHFQYRGVNSSVLCARRFYAVRSPIIIFWQQFELNTRLILCTFEYIYLFLFTLHKENTDYAYVNMLISYSQCFQQQCTVLSRALSLSICFLCFFLCRTLWCIREILHCDRVWVSCRRSLKTTRASIVFICFYTIGRA